MTLPISLVITSYNRERYLSATIESILAQTWTDFELLIWDDGSTDASVAICRDYAQQDRRVRVIAAPHQGRVPALKAAISHTRGTYLGWVDSDDLLAPTALAETAAILNAEPDVGLVYTNYYDINESNDIIGYGYRTAVPYSKERILTSLMTFHFRLIRRSAFEQAGGIDERFQYAEEYDLCLRLSEITQVRHLQKWLYYYRSNPDSISYAKQTEQAYYSHAAIVRSLQRRGLSDRFEVMVQTQGTGATMRCWFSWKRKFCLLTSYTLAFLTPQNLSPNFSINNKSALLTKGGWGVSIPIKEKTASIITTAGLSLAAISLATNIGIKPGQTQSIIPAPDGTDTTVTINANQFDIQGGTLSGDGTNLFHSFQQFRLANGEIANFLANSNIRNILGRVIGGDPSIINGLLQVTGGNLNLFLMNPAGIVFGANAQLNVPASFTATTATGIGFPGGWFNGFGTNDYNMLVGSPNAFRFETSQPGAIINAGNLAVSPGENLSLIGGTVISTGTLQAGNITVTSVPGTSLVRVSQAGQILSLEIEAPPNTQSITPLSLAELLTGSGIDSSSGVAVNPSGKVALASSGIEVQPGDITVHQVKAKTATLSAHRNLTLSESQLVTTGDMNLLAQDTVRVRDSVANPVVIHGGGNLSIQGHQNIDILALNHPQTPFVSGGNLSLVSDGVISGDAHFASAGSFSILNLSGEPGNFFSLFDPIISANGDVAFGNYTGVSLKVEAKGSITTGRIDINGVDAAIPTTDPDVVKYSLNTQPGLVLRAGRTVLDNPPNVPQIGVGGTDFTSTGGASSPGNVTVLGDISIGNFGYGSIVGGPVIIEASGSIQTLQIDTFALLGNGGEISLTAANGNINTGNLNSYSTPGNGGAITLTANNGSISTGTLQSQNYSSGTGKGGAISLTAINGSISTNSLSSYSNTGNGGGVTLNATNDITITGVLNSYSVASSGNTGSGGAIALSSTQGNISTQDLNSYSTAGNGGAIIINANNGSISTSNLTSRSTPSSNISGNGGAIALSAGSDINVSGSLSSFSSGNDNGNGGAISLSAGSNINISGSLDSYSSGANSGGSGGAITLTAINGRINTGSLSSFYSGNGNGNGGAISLSAGSDINVSGSLSSFYSGNGNGNGGAIFFKGGNDITITGSLNTLSNGGSGSSNGDGGAISLTTTNDISISGDLYSLSQSNLGTAGDGGVITIMAGNNITILGTLVSITSGILGSGKGGIISLNAGHDINVYNPLYSYSQSSFGTSKDGAFVRIDAGNTIAITSINPTDLTGSFKYGNINLTANEINLTGGINSIRGDNANLTIQAKTPNQGIIIGGTTDSGTTNLDLLTTDLAAIKNGFTSITIGRAEDTGTITLNPYNFNAPVNIAGGSTLVGLNQNTTWTITGADRGSISGFSNGLTFSSIENLIGGSTEDTFIFNNGANISGTIDGGAATDTLDYSRFTSPITVNLANNTLLNIEQVIGGAASDTIIGANTDNTWVVSANNIGIINNIFSFSAFETLIGGTANDTFLFNSGQLANLAVDANLGNDSITVNSPTNLTGNISLSTGSDGGDITINDTLDGSANLTLSAGTGNITFSSSLGKSIPLGNLTINSAHNLIGGEITAASITHSNGTGTIILGNLQTTNGLVNLATANDLIAGNISTSGAEIRLTSQTGKIHTDNLDSSAGNGAIQLTSANDLIAGNITTSGGEISLTSKTGIINSSNLISSGTSGGNITINAAISITAGDIDSSGSIGDGGNVTLDPISDIQVSTINAQGGSNGKGGNVDITTQQFFRATDTFLDRNGTATSISTAGGLGGGDITIRHGGNGLIPFEVGNATTNGTVGAISSDANNTISPNRFFLFNYTQDNIKIITQGIDAEAQSQIAIALQPQHLSPQTLPSIVPNVSINRPDRATSIWIALEDSFTNEFKNYLNLTSNPYVGVTHSNQNSDRTDDKTGTIGATNDNSEKNLNAARQTLSNAEAATGIKPALIYVVFAPDTIGSANESNTPETAVEKLLNKEDAESNSVPSAKQPTVGTQNPTPQPTDQLQLILVTAEGEPILKKVPGATREKVIALATHFRREITNPLKLNTTTYLEPAQQLYQWTIAQLDTELKSRKIENLVFILDRHLRSLPMAALHDGQGFLIERYSIGLMPSLSLVDTRYVDIKNSQVLGMGASHFQDQNPLPAASEEVKVITQQLWQGQSFTEEDFTFNKLVSERQQIPFGIIHLATHGEFKPGVPSNSYIQLSDRKLGLDEVRQLGWNNPPVELLVLSACRTALGDEEAELGFAGLAVQAGVKTAVASLWYVSDEGSLTLMTEFYRHLREAPIKAEALRQAQVALLKGQARLEEGELRGSGENIPLPPELVNLGNKTLSHPYYWSAFTMIGSPW